MFLSKLILNERNRQVQYDLGNAHKLHQQIMHAFPDEADQHSDSWNPRQEWNILFRQEPDSSMILVQSDIEPHWEVLPKDYLSERAPTPFAIKLFNPTVEMLEKRHRFQFRLKANPSKRDHSTGKTVGFFKQKEQMAWLERQGDRLGFRLLEANIIPLPKLYGTKKDRSQPVQIQTALFHGSLEVTDSPLFLGALRQGIGRGKAYGCGLLSIATLRH